MFAHAAHLPASGCACVVHVFTCCEHTVARVTRREARCLPGLCRMPGRAKVYCGFRKRVRVRECQRCCRWDTGNRAQLPGVGECQVEFAAYLPLRLCAWTGRPGGLVLGNWMRGAVMLTPDPLHRLVYRLSPLQMPVARHPRCQECSSPSSAASTEQERDSWPKSWQAASWQAVGSACRANMRATIGVSWTG